MRNPRERLRDVIEAIANVERYAVRGRKAFEEDELIQNWIVRHLQIIGEAVRALPAPCRRSSACVTSSSMSVSHRYLGSAGRC